VKISGYFEKISIVTDRKTSNARYGAATSLVSSLLLLTSMCIAELVFLARVWRAFPRRPWDDTYINAGIGHGSPSLVRTDTPQSRSI
jgi:hypothetical protein